MMLSVYPMHLLSGHFHLYTDETAFNRNTSSLPNYRKLQAWCTQTPTHAYTHKPHTHLPHSSPHHTHTHTTHKSWVNLSGPNGWAKDLQVAPSSLLWIFRFPPQRRGSHFLSPDFQCTLKCFVFGSALQKQPWKLECWVEFGCLARMCHTARLVHLPKNKLDYLFIPLSRECSSFPPGYSAWESERVLLLSQLESWILYPHP